jgi:hypothetical protein
MKNHILNRESYLKEALWKGVIDRSKTGKAREEDVPGHHHFTDGNGVKHKHGVKPDYEVDPRFLIELIKEAIIKQKDKNDVIDLNYIDMSETSTISDLFPNVFDDLEDEIEKDELYNLKFDTSGWIMTNLQRLNHAFQGLTSDIGINNWKINKDKLDINWKVVEGSYYESHLPEWYEFDPVDWIRSLNIMYPSKDSIVEDEERTKQLGKKCYIVSLHNSCTINFIPEQITIDSIDGVNDSGSIPNTKIHITKLTSLDRFPESFDADQNVILYTNLNNIKDNPLIIPKGIKKLCITSKDDVTRLPKHIDYGIEIRSKSQLGHFITVRGNMVFFSLGHSKYDVDSFKGSPKKVGGSFLCNNNQFIKTLEGCPEEVVKDFSVGRSSSLVSLKGCPKYVGGNFGISSNKLLKQIDDFPEYVGGHIDISYNDLDSLEGLPEEVKGDIILIGTNVRSFKGLPKKIGGCIKISNSTTLDGKKVDKNDIIKENPDLKPSDIKVFEVN